MSLGSDVAHAHHAEQSCDCSRDTPGDCWRTRCLSSCEGEWNADTQILHHRGAGGPLLWAVFSTVTGSGAPARDTLAQCPSSVAQEMYNLSLASCKSGKCLRKEPCQRTAPCLFLLSLRKLRLATNSHGFN